MTAQKTDERKAAYEKAIDKPTATLDVNPVIVTPEKKVVLAKRISSVQDGGKWSMPGGKIFVGERIENTLKRISYLKTGLTIELMFPTLNQSLVGVYDDPGRDPRAHVVGVTFLCRKVSGEIKAGGNSDEVKAFSEEEIKSLPLAFDHEEVLKDAFRIMREKGGG